MADIELIDLVQDNNRQPDYVNSDVYLRVP
jgi:hypothetical protein